MYYKSVKQFQISTRCSGRLRIIQVCVYDTVEEMRKAGERHSKSIGSGSIGLDKCWGLCQSFDKELIYSDGRVERSPQAGFIRLVKEALKMGIITHEATHMAWGIYRDDVQKTIPDMEREEKLCYLVGDIASQITKRLYKYNLIPDPNS